MRPDPALSRAFQSTWPALEYHDAGGFRSARSDGGGGRISSTATTSDDWTEAGIEAAEAAQAAWAQPAIFRLWDGEDRLADSLTARGYARTRTAFVMECPAGPLASREAPVLSAFTLWPPLAIQREIWAEGQIDAPRQAAMARVTVPRISILGRIRDHAAGAAFLGADAGVAMFHALYVRPAYRRAGLAGWMICQAAAWAQTAGAPRLALAVAAENAPAVALYRKLGFRTCATYRYWTRPEG